jgi:hypothetical protein
MRIHLLAPCMLALFLAPGCGQEEEVTQDKTATPVPALTAPAHNEAPRNIELESRTDTVSTLHREEGETDTLHATGHQIRFMVQVGAFRDPLLASRIQRDTRNRYHLPVLNDYHAALKLYQIRVGFFSSREEAHLFRQKMIEQFPADYNDSWVVQLRR